MSRTPRIVAAALFTVAFVGQVAPATADYMSHPELRPGTRCADLAEPRDCQPMIWDLPAATYLGAPGARAEALPAHPDFPGGMTDRPPPLYVYDDVSGIPPELQGFDDPQAALTFYDRPYHPLCPDPDDPTAADPDRVPYWRQTAADPKVFEVDCRRGSRAYYGPWTLGTDPTISDGLAYKVVTFGNADRLAAEGALSELNVSSEVYDHVGSHHGTCYVSTNRCATDPEYAATAACDGFRSIATTCPAEGPSTECRLQQAYGFVAFRSTTARQGRYTMDLPEGKAFPVVEDPMWLCQQHLVAVEPDYAGRMLNFRNQENGAVGELVIQLFTEPVADESYTPVSMAFDFVASAATTLVPPFTVGTQETVWYAPFDLAVGMMTMHSHQKMVKGTIDVLPANPLRPAADDPGCGAPVGDLPNAHIYENYDYFEPEICEYWREQDGPLILRKGQGIRAECLINNGVTPTEHLADPTLRTAIEQSPVGETLYGRQGPAPYRVRYGCERVPNVPPGEPGDPARDCPANPDGEGPYPAPPGHCPTNLGYTGRCVPANVIFANTGEDSMCIPILMYWPLDRIVGADGSIDEEAAARLLAGDVNEVGTPGRVWKSPSDGGTCDDGAGADAPGVDDPNSVTLYRSRNCRAGL